MDDLHLFKYSGKAKTNGEKMRELHQIWREVYTDLEQIKAVHNLDSAHCLERFVAKFPVELQKEYLKFKEKYENSDRSLRI